LPTKESLAAQSVAVMSGTTSSDRKMRFSMAFSAVRLGARSRVAQVHFGDQSLLRRVWRMSK
jgi:hypothetical protein